jgi:hypothetical protein
MPRLFIQPPAHAVGDLLMMMLCRLLFPVVFPVVTNLVICDNFSVEYDEHLSKAPSVCSIKGA